jgi:hypothetical protein
MLGRRATSVALAALVGMSGAAVVASPAHAVGGNCQARIGHKPVTGPDHYRPEAHCTSLQADSRARGALDLIASPDAYSAWFTQTKVWKYGQYDDYVGVRSAYTQVRAI